MDFSELPLNSPLLILKDTKQLHKQWIKQAIKNGKHIFVIPWKKVEHDPNAMYEISNVRIKNGIVEGQSKTLGYWYQIEFWEQRS